jgi:preprotein translocase subunit SecA
MAGGSSEAEQERAKPQRSKSAGLPGRNDLCPCGSGKKFKNCHMGREDEIRHLIGQGGAPKAAPSAAAVAQRLPGGAAAAAREAAIAAEAEKIRQATAAAPGAGQAAPQAQRGRPAPAAPRGKKK